MIYPNQVDTLLGNVLRVSLLHHRLRRRWSYSVVAQECLSFKQSRLGNKMRDPLETISQLELKMPQRRKRASLLKNLGETYVLSLDKTYT